MFTIRLVCERLKAEIYEEGKVVDEGDERARRDMTTKES